MSFDAWGKRRETGWLPIGANGIVTFDTKTTTRGCSIQVCVAARSRGPRDDRFGRPGAHEWAHLRSRDRPLFVRRPTCAGARQPARRWNRYSYVINNPLSLTDPSGFFFSGLFRAIGNFLSSAFRAIGNVVKVALSNPIIRSIVQIVGCAAAAAVLGPAGPAGCAAVSALVTLGSGGSLRDALKAAAITFATIGIFSAVGPTLNAIASTGVGGVLIKAAVHGVIGGALSVAQGGSFLQGFAGSAIGALGGALAGGEGGSGIAGQYGDGIFVNQLARALISGAAGCAGAVVTGGKCAQAAVTAAFGSLYNGDGGILRKAQLTAFGGLLGTGAGLAVAAACDAGTAGLCVFANPVIVSGGAAIGATIGLAAASIGDLLWNGSAANDNTIAHRNASYSQEPTELYNLINKSTGEIDKIGITSNPRGRYDAAYLATENVIYKTAYQFSTRAPALLAENIALVSYRAANGGNLPRLNRVER